MLNLLKISRFGIYGLNKKKLQLNFHLRVCFHDEKMLPILFNAHIRLIWSSLLYNLHTFEAFVTQISLYSPIKNVVSIGVNIYEILIN